MQSNSGTYLLTLGETAKRLHWSVRTLRSRLRDYGIGTIGRGRIARVTEQDFARLIEAERQFVPAPSPGVNPADREGASDRANAPNKTHQPNGERGTRKGKGP
jgi:hypothetical protein